ncbi:acyl-CoA thioesterase [Xylanibacillus composti]|uniref:Acyl-CoA thioesterase n=1 Tax=Xylanibacillus composti TaxID=1572762 RepID=A0A8J4H5F3_9BACL|nr:thioesterase family protein [Xylanibacillus composti]MDT9724791.1 acyl-CoA thioesterase [Xylanibacillus composti]GIQ69856.1 hypothetical protein XYCOK13_26800 [Xylanibacillus composti]
MKGYAVESRWFEHTIRVRYQETDQMRVVYHTHYANWFEWGRAEMIREAGMPYREMEDRGLMLPVTALDVAYRLPARYDDEVCIRTRLTAFSPIRLAFGYEIVREKELLASGSTEHIWLNTEWKPVRLDRAAPDMYALLLQIVFGESEGKEGG